jgi:hypothetical protein
MQEAETCMTRLVDIVESLIASNTYINKSTLSQATLQQAKIKAT